MRRINPRESVLIQIACIPWCKRSLSHPDWRGTMDVWTHFWKPRTLSTLGLDKRYAQRHGSKAWRYMALSVMQWFGEQTPLTLENGAELDAVASKRSRNVFYVSGLFDNVYFQGLFDALPDSLDRKRQVYSIPCGHFTHFSSQGWLHTKTALDAIVKLEIQPGPIARPCVGDSLAKDICNMYNLKHLPYYRTGASKL